MQENSIRFIGVCWLFCHPFFTMFASLFFCVVSICERLKFTGSKSNGELKTNKSDPQTHVQQNNKTQLTDRSHIALYRLVVV